MENSQINQNKQSVENNMIQLTQEEQITWFFENYYETGMELPILLESFKDTDLDNFVWYDEKIIIPKYINEKKL